MDLLSERTPCEVDVDRWLRGPSLKIQSLNVFQDLRQVLELLCRLIITWVSVGMILEDKLSIVRPSELLQSFKRLLGLIKWKSLKTLYPLRGESHHGRVSVARGLVHTQTRLEELFYFRGLKADFHA